MNNVTDFFVPITNYYDYVFNLNYCLITFVHKLNVLSLLFQNKIVN